MPCVLTKNFHRTIRIAFGLLARFSCASDIFGVWFARCSGAFFEWYAQVGAEKRPSVCQALVLESMELPRGRCAQAAVVIRKTGSVKENDAVLFVPLGVYAFEQQLATALYLASQSEFRPHFLLISQEDHSFVDQLESAGIPYNTLEPLQRISGKPGNSSSHDSPQGLTPRITTLLKWVRRFARMIPGISLFRLFFLGWRLWRKKPVAKKLIQHWVI